MSDVGHLLNYKGRNTRHTRKPGDTWNTRAHTLNYIRPCGRTRHELPEAACLVYETMHKTFLRDNIALFCLAAVAILLVIARACLQSVTLDEANSCLGFARNPLPLQW